MIKQETPYQVKQETPKRESRVCLNSDQLLSKAQVVAQACQKVVELINQAADRVKLFTKQVQDWVKAVIQNLESKMGLIVKTQDDA